MVLKSFQNDFQGFLCQCFLSMFSVCRSGVITAIHAWNRDIPFCLTLNNREALSDLIALESLGSSQSKIWRHISTVEPIGEWPHSCCKRSRIPCLHVYNSFKTWLSRLLIIFERASKRTSKAFQKLLNGLENGYKGFQKAFKVPFKGPYMFLNSFQNDFQGF